MKNTLLVPVAALLLSATIVLPAIAQDTGAQVAAQSRTLEGGVQKIDLSLEHLRDVGLDLKEIMTSSRHLYDEVTLQPVAMVTQPSMIGPGTIINIPVGTRPVGTVQPPRKKRVDVAMNNMTPIIQMFKQNSDEFVADQRQLDVSDAAKEQLKPLIGDWISNVNKISSELEQLQSLTQGPKYDNASIAAVCTNMQGTAQAMEKVRSKAFKIMKREQEMTPVMDSLPLWALFLLSTLGALACTEMGFRIGMRRSKEATPANDAPVGTMVGSTLGLLAFMMAFTFGVATTRFETRRLLVVKEANAIGTAYLRTDILEEPSRTNLKKLLHDYVAIRIEGAKRLVANELGVQGAREIIAKSNDLQKGIWSETAVLGQKHPNWPVYSLFIDCINNMIDTQSERVAAAINARVPGAVWDGLFLAGALAMMGTGYYCGLCRERNTSELAIMSLAFSVALVLVVDLDRPLEGNITTSQQPIIDLGQSIGIQ